jgi:crotonobetainyl-CoA:carnitine CoA-transferase CaiB-like acyl-CoA transferase
MYDALMGMSNIALSSALARLSGTDGTPAIEVWGNNPRYRLYATRDGGQVAVCLLETKIWKKFCDHAGLEHLVREENQSDRLTGHGPNADEYKQALTAYFAGRNCDEMVSELNALNLPVMAVLSPDEAVRSEHAIARNVVTTSLQPSGVETHGLRPHPLCETVFGSNDHASPEMGAVSKQPR